MNMLFTIFSQRLVYQNKKAPSESGGASTKDKPKPKAKDSGTDWLVEGMAGLEKRQELIPKIDPKTGFIKEDPAEIALRKKREADTKAADARRQLEAKALEKSPEEQSREVFAKAIERLKMTNGTYGDFLAFVQKQGVRIDSSKLKQLRIDQSRKISQIPALILQNIIKIAADEFSRVSPQETFGFSEEEA